VSSQSKQFALSVVIVNWNTRDLLRACLASLADECESLAGDTVQVVVVDNGSTDGSAEMVSNEFPWVHFDARRRNSGFAAANNAGVRLTNGRYVLLLNPDTEIRPGALKTMISFLDTHPEAGAIGPRLTNPDGSLQLSCYPVPTLLRELWRLLHLDLVRPLAVYPIDTWDSNNPHQVETVQGACLMVRNSVLEQVGLLDENFFVYTEEIDFCRRVASKGWALYWLPTALVVHYGGQSTRQAATKMFIQLYRSKLQYFRKHYGVVGGFAYKLILLLAILPRITVAPLAWPFSSLQREKLRSVSRLYGLLLLELKTL